MREYDEFQTNIESRLTRVEWLIILQILVMAALLAVFSIALSRI